MQSKAVRKVSILDVLAYVPSLYTPFCQTSTSTVVEKDLSLARNACQEVYLSSNHSLPMFTSYYDPPLFLLKQY